MRRKLLCLLLCLVLLVSLVPAFGTTAFAADENGITNPPEAKDESEKLHLTKTLSPGQNGTYDITMESWATGEVKTQGIVEKVPTDFVVVVDQSGSMDTTDMPIGTPTIQSNKTLEDVANDSKGYYYYDEDTQNYYRVYGVKDYLFRYYPANYWYVGDIVERLGQKLHWFMGNTESDPASFSNQLYFRETVGDQVYYQPLTMTVKGVIGAYDVRFKYNSKKTNSEIWFNRNDETYMNGHHAPWYKNLAGGGLIDDNWGVTMFGRQIGYPQVDGIVQGLYTYDEEYCHSTFTIIPGLWKLETGMYVNYPMYARHVGYTKLCYRDVNGIEHEVPSNQNDGQTTWEYCDDDGYARSQQESDSTRPTYSNLYKYSEYVDRVTALKGALTEFAQAVANETDDFGKVDNRVSIVGFSHHDHNNTELLTHTEKDISGGSWWLSGSDGWQKNTCDNNISEYYGKALVAPTDGNIGTVNPKIENAIKAISADGGTQPEDGLNMAYQILTNRGDGEGKTTYKIRSGANKDQVVDRNTIVIFFTDGQPGDYFYSNQYSEANEVVEQALDIKNYKDTSLFSIGVFGESDGNPLTYDARNDWTKNEKGEDVRVGDQDEGFWEYLGGWVETRNGYCLRRQWRPNNAEGYTATPNDTIFDYMSVVSSNYKTAEEFIAPVWLNGDFDGNYIAATEGVRHNSVEGNQYYRMASSQDTLVAAFMNAVTMNNEEITSDTSVALNNNAIFKDKVNTADFDTTGATYTVTYQPVKVSGDEIVNDDSREASTPVNGEAYPAAGISHTGFNYSESYVTSVHPGYKLIVTINGLTPKKAVGELKSNDGNAGVYGPEDEEPTVSIASPTLQYPESASKTYLIDYNTKMKVATDATKLVGAEEDTVTGTNGNFVKSGTDVTYQLNSDKQADKTAEINKVYTGVDTATVYGKLVNVENAKVGWNQITTVPASSVYYSDKLDTAVTVGDGSGYNAALADQTNHIGTSASQSAENVSGSFYFTFYGTGIDVYCTTHENGGFVSATLFNGSGASACVKDNRVGPVKTVREYSAGDYYNTPAVSFTGLTAGTYTLKLVANDKAQYKLDGVRVYNPVQKGSAAETELNKTDEANATYLNLRKVLLNDYDGKDVFTVTNEIPTGEVDPSAVSGALFIDDVSSVVTTSNWYKDPGATEETWHDKPGQIYQSQFDVYKANGPKNEIYLNNGQAVTFQLNTAKFDENTKVYIGLSAPVTGSGDVVINGEAVDPAVTTVMDMYYPIDIDLDQAVNNSLSVTVENTGSGIISVTNLKITGVADLIPAATQNNQQDVLNATRALFAPMTMKAVRMAVNNGVDPEAETVEPEDPAVTEDPEDPAVTEDPDDPEKPDDGSLVIDDPEETETPTPSVTPDTPAKPGNALQRVIQSITKAISSFFKSIFRR